MLPNTTQVSKIPGRRGGGGGGGGVPYKSDGDARREIQIKPLREANVSVAQT